MTTQNLTPAPAATLTLAKTGLCSGRPALIGYEGKNTVLLVLPEEEGSDWSEIDRSAHGFLRGLGQMMKKLDKDSARNPSDAPAWAVEADAPAAFQIPVEERPYLAAIYAGPAPEAQDEDAMDDDGPGELPGNERLDREARAFERKGEPAENAVTAGEVPAEAPVAVVSPLAPYLSADVVAEISTTTDLAFLRAAREDAVKAGAGPEALRVISMRAGEVVLGLDPGALRRAVKPAAVPKAPTVRAEQVARPATRQKHIGIREMIASHIVNVGDKVHLRSNPELTTTIANNGDSADGGSLCAWTKRVTGWSAVDIYSNLIHSQSGKLLREFRG